MLSPGDRLRDYEVIAPLTEGGMATLVLARRRGVGGFSRIVVLKLIHPHLTEDSRMIRLFLDEARVSARVTHPNVVHVEEVGVHDGLYFIAMEYVHGVSLSHLSRLLSQERRRMSPSLAVCLVAQVAEALQAAHEAVGVHGEPLRVVHRDVSPQNVLLAHTGHVKLIDFGIAKSHAALHESRTGAAVLGKLRYMAPEQLKSSRVDLRTDIYALGVVLWELLTARKFLLCQRFDDPRDLATRIDPPPPSQHSSLVRGALDRVVLCALAVDPAKRHKSAIEFRRALLKAQPEAARLDAPKLARILRAVAGEELDARASMLPREVNSSLEVPAAQPQPETLESLSDLTIQLSAADVDPVSERTPGEATERTQRVEAGPSIRSILPSHRSYLTPSSDSASPYSETLRPVPLYSRLLPTIAVGSLCLAIGLWFGRATLPRVPGQVVEAPTRPTSIAAGSLEPGASAKDGEPLTGLPTTPPELPETHTAAAAEQEPVREAQAQAQAVETRHPRPTGPATRLTVRKHPPKRKFSRPKRR